MYTVSATILFTVIFVVAIVGIYAAFFCDDVSQDESLG